MTGRSSENSKGEILLATARPSRTGLAFQTTNREPSMRAILISAIVFASATVSGCGKSDGLLRTQGRLLKGGEESVPAEGEYIQITFVPIPQDGKPAMDYYYADVNQDAGTFRPA